MAVRVFCNACFCEPRQATPRFLFTSCGHVICELCFQKGKKDECLICRTPCRTIFLSKETSPDIQSLFMGIDTLCKKYSKEITQYENSSTNYSTAIFQYKRPNGYSSFSLQPSHPSTSEIMEPMEIDPLPSPMRKPETGTGPIRLSLITPPQDGRMASWELSKIQIISDLRSRYKNNREVKHGKVKGIANWTRKKGMEREEFVKKW
ncbi:putative E3 SUMO-protein ligase RNF212 [Aix galericulata]|nr:putative E3 SUMO-protein ligase RNF212 [Aix galericulata]